MCHSVCRWILVRGVKDSTTRGGTASGGKVKSTQVGWLEDLVEVAGKGFAVADAEFELDLAIVFVVNRSLAVERREQVEKSAVQVFRERVAECEEKLGIAVHAQFGKAFVK